MSLLAGEAACLTAALLWAVSVQIFSAPLVRHGARAVNLFKCSFAAFALGLTLVGVGGFRILAAAPRADLALVALSGLVGLTLGDTALFIAVNRVGVHRSLLLQTLGPVFAAAAAWPLGERLTATQILASVVILTGVVVVLAGRTRAVAPGRVSHPAAGITAGVVAALGQGVGVVIAKVGMVGVPILPATFVRLAIGALGLVAVAAVSGDTGRAIAAWRDRTTLSRLAAGSLFGTYVAMILMMAGIAWAPASVAAVLLATPPIFALGVEAVVDRRWPSPAGVIGTLIAVAGVAMLTAM